MVQQIVIYGGSFNPITRAHEAVIKSVVDNIRPDFLLVVPTQVHAYGNKRLLPVENRVAICDAAVSSFSNNKTTVVAENRELTLAKRMNPSLPEGTTFRYLLAELDFARMMFAENVEISFVVGQDQAEDIAAGKWFRGEQLVSLFRAIIVPRGSGGLITEETCPWAFMRDHVILPSLPGDVADLSSTKAREALSNGTDVRHILSDAALETIKNLNISFS